jgi:hypothetical protein
MRDGINTQLSIILGLDSFALCCLTPFSFLVLFLLLLMGFFFVLIFRFIFVFACQDYYIYSFKRRLATGWLFSPGTPVYKCLHKK